MAEYKISKDTDPAGVHNMIVATKEFVKENYSSDGWSYELIVPPEPSQKQINLVARMWRDEELANTDNIAQTPDFPNRDVWLSYRKELRDWPTTSSFPNTKPSKPA